MQAHGEGCRTAMAEISDNLLTTPTTRRKPGLADRRPSVKRPAVGVRDLAACRLLLAAPRTPFVPWRGAVAVRDHVRDDLPGANQPHRATYRRHVLPTEAA